MYRCRCGEFFDFPNKYKTDEGYEYLCPACKSEDYEEVEECEMCHRLFSTEELEDGFCEECARRIIKDFQAIVGTYMSPTEIKYIKPFIDIL